MSKSARFGGVTVQFNDDGTLFVYQPDSSRVMSGELAEQLFVFLRDHIFPVRYVDGEAIRRDIEEVVAFSAVPAGVINTSEGAVDPEADAAIAALNAGAQPEPRAWEPGEVEALGGDKVIEPSKPAPRRRGRPRKAQG